MQVVRSAVYPVPNRGFGRTDRQPRLVRRSARWRALQSSGPADAVIVETPPLLLAGSSIAYARGKRAALIVNVSDMWPDSAVELGTLAPAPPGERSPRARARLLPGGRRDRLPDPGNRDRAGAARGGRREGPPDPAERRSGRSFPARRLAPTARSGSSTPGTVGMSQGVGTLMDAAELLDDESAIEIVIAGDGAEGPELRRRLAEGRLPNVTMLGRVPHERIPELYAEADAAVVLLRDRPSVRGGAADEDVRGDERGPGRWSSLRRVRPRALVERGLLRRGGARPSGRRSLRPRSGTLPQTVATPRDSGPPAGALSRSSTRGSWPSTAGTGCWKKWPARSRVSCPARLGVWLLRAGRSARPVP